MKLVQNSYTAKRFSACSRPCTGEQTKRWNNFIGQIVFYTVIQFVCLSTGCITLQVYRPLYISIHSRIIQSFLQWAKPSFEQVYVSFQEMPLKFVPTEQNFISHNVSSSLSRLLLEGVWNLFFFFFWTMFILEFTLSYTNCRHSDWY